MTKKIHPDLNVCQRKVFFYGSLRKTHRKQIWLSPVSLRQLGDGEREWDRKKEKREREREREGGRERLRAEPSLKFLPHLIKKNLQGFQKSAVFPWGPTPNGVRVCGGLLRKKPPDNFFVPATKMWRNERAAFEASSKGRLDTMNNAPINPVPAASEAVLNRVSVLSNKLFYSHAITRI